MKVDKGSPEDEELILDLILVWEEASENGLDLSARDICVDHPHLERQVSEQISKLKKMGWLSQNIESTEIEPKIPPNTLIGNRFRIEAVIGFGGFGDVYRAFDTDLGRHVALKFEKPNHRSDQKILLSEARKAANLRHSNIVTVHDIGKHNDYNFIVSELIEGEDLKEIADKRDLNLIQTCNWMQQVAEALDYSHCKGIVHRDLKPSNIIIDKNNQAKVSDFGIAFHVDEIDEVEPSIGTLPYMSPEQLSGESKQLSSKSDIFSLGVVFLELLTGTHPFVGKSDCKTIINISSANPAEISKIPIQLRKLCENCLAKNPESRPTALEIALELKSFLESNTKSKKRAKVISSLSLTYLLLISLSLALVLMLRNYKNISKLYAKISSDSENNTIKSTNSKKSETSRSIDNLSDLKAKEPQSPNNTNANILPNNHDAKLKASVNSQSENDINLLKLVDPSKNAIRGSWTKQNGLLTGISPDGEGHNAGAAIQIPYKPSSAYTINLIARRFKNGGIVIPVVYSGRQFGVYLSGGFSGSKIPDAVPEFKVNEDFFPTLDWHRIKMQVGSDEIRCESDSGAVLEWHGGFNSILGRPYDIPDPTGLYLKVWGEFQIKTLSITLSH